MAHAPLHARFGRAVRELRLEKNLSQEELAHRTGLHRNHVGQIERGELSPTLTTIEVLAAVLETRPSVLVARAEESV